MLYTNNVPACIETIISIIVDQTYIIEDSNKFGYKSGLKQLLDSNMMNTVNTKTSEAHDTYVHHVTTSSIVVIEK